MLVFTQCNVIVSEKYVKVINGINPFILFISKKDWYFEDLKKCLMLNLKNITIFSFSNSLSSFKLTFVNSPIMILNSDFDQKLQIMWKSIILELNNEGLKNILLFKEDSKKWKISDCIYVPFASGISLKISEFKTISSPFEFNQNFEHVNINSLTKNIGLIIPLKFLDQAYFYEDTEFINLWKVNQKVVNEILKAKDVAWNIMFPDDLLEIKEMFPDSVSHIEYSCFNWFSSIIIN